MDGHSKTTLVIVTDDLLKFLLAKIECWQMVVRQPQALDHQFTVLIRLLPCRTTGKRRAVHPELHTPQAVTCGIVGSVAVVKLSWQSPDSRPNGSIIVV